MVGSVVERGSSRPTGGGVFQGCNRLDQTTEVNERGVGVQSHSVDTPSPGPLAGSETQNGREGL